MTFQNEFTTAVIEALDQRQATYRACPMCRSRAWTLANGVIMSPLVMISGRIMSQSTALPSVALVCNTCAFIAYYSLVALELGHLIPS